MKAYLGELIGTFVLVFAGCGSAVLAGGHIALPALRPRLVWRCLP